MPESFESISHPSFRRRHDTSRESAVRSTGTDVPSAPPLVGATVVAEGVHYCVWAPDQDSVAVVTEQRDPVGLERNGEGYFSGLDREGRAGDCYTLRIADGTIPDPASRFQPRGVEGPSQVVDPGVYQWRMPSLRPPLRGRVIYELHIGAFTPAGTFTGAIERLDDLVELGVNAIELMPLGDFPGRWNWGYDGVMIYAPARCYGTPDELRALIDAAHLRGLAVIIDVVYNHLGPCGNVLPRLARDYFHSQRESIWGQGFNFDGPNSGPVRAFFLQNACAWLDEYRADGLRLDAVHAIHDSSATHIVADIAAEADARGAFVIAEDERNDARIVTDRPNGWGAHGMWSDDFHHTVRVALTGQQEAYYANYTGSSDEWQATLRKGWLYDGQYYPSWQRERGSKASDLPPERFVFCISNHDQVGNRPLGDRLNEVVSLESYRAVSMLLCLVPYTPMLFMGQEWAASSPFPFFTDLPGDVGKNMAQNRLNEFRHYNAVYDPDTLIKMPDPQAESTFASAKLRWEERTEPKREGVLALYRDCLQLRAREEIFQSAARRDWEVQNCGESALIVRWRGSSGDWLLAVSVKSAEVNCGDNFSPALDRRWKIKLWSNARKYAGDSTTTAERRLEVDPAIIFRGPGAVLLHEE